MEHLDDSTMCIFMCSECHSTLNWNIVPHYALKNQLYRGHLPDEFHDITWVEEMVCSLYRNMAHVTHLYQSSDPAQPQVFHGNTCAHKMNIMSTATVLPCTPSNVNGDT